MELLTTTLASLESHRAAGVHWTALGNQVVLWGPDGSLSAHPGVRRSPGELRLVTQLGRLFRDEHPDVPVLVDAGRYLVVSGPTEPPPGRDCCYRVQPLPVDGVVYATLIRDVAARRAPLAWVRDLVGRTDPAGFAADLTTLAVHPTRHSTSAGFAAAAAWARDRLAALGYRTSEMAVRLPDGGSTSNVIGERDGAGPGPRQVVLVTAHLDSVNTAGGPSAPAPGADDNASGGAALLQVAVALRGHRGSHDLRLILFGGEEQGLHGSRAYVAGLPAAERARIAAVVNMDMVGCRNTPAPTVLLEGAPLSQPVIDRLAGAAATYTGLTVQTSLSPFASDHVPFLDAGIPAVLTIEGADGTNSAIHTAGDTLDRIDHQLALEIIRMNAAAVATAIGREEGTVVSGPIELDLPELEPILPHLRRRLSGRYVFNGGAGGRGDDLEAAADPTDPVLTPLPPVTTLTPEILEALRRPRFTLHVDIDGTDPLGVVSATVRPSPLIVGTAAHVIGRVTANTGTLLRRDLVADDIVLPWGTVTVDRLEITIERPGLLGTPQADVTFVATAANRRFGPYRAAQESIWFREVEVEVDVEDGAVSPEPYDTQLHPDRPGDLPRETLTLESAFAKAGIRITRSNSSNTIDTSAAGANRRWNFQELHDAMADHWNAFANVPQWKMWLFNAELADSDTLGGVMFDGDIDEPGGVDRQGTALFTLSPHFHTAGGAYPQANPPAAEAARRELFFDLVHETGHAFNLAHSFQKQAVLADPGSGAWPAPAWMPLRNNAQALSWMNYPDEASPGSGLSAEWFYDRFRFRFDDGENLFLRHAPARFVQMGNEAWFHNHGRAGRGTLDRRLELVVRTRSQAVEFGEPVFCELRLRNVSDQPVLAVTNLDPAEGVVELTVTTPSGRRRPFLSFYRTCARPQLEVLAPGESRYQEVNLTMGMFGFPFTEPGGYRIEACWTNADGSTAPAAMIQHVRPAASDHDRSTARELFAAPVGRVLAVGGTRTLGEVNERIAFVTRELGARHPAAVYLTAARALPLAGPHKVLAADATALRVLDAEPDVVERELAPIVEQSKVAADALGHIGYERVMDAYTDCALKVRKKAKARAAQREMLSLFEARKVIEPVVEKVRDRVRELA
ncbi:M28 family metallopeptidase [Pseudonocardia asaccharolytica]|uniref:Peptidase M28 domain-containing protein n=1 Tax=Pseudonocardia asaccharolytica DSM 44247 = NBRC 16224 TaxID=1123024 RepID=A0A511D3X7_9PSEU|nr:M28 family metallopeptidase [Pseudonocardia asaccharolytica]GEL19489.1 hypothetical protein PA7_33260 [Pseudonocardia asaccharolytica DSM 44247 = NBRC 16224]